MQQHRGFFFVHPMNKNERFSAENNFFRRGFCPFRKRFAPALKVFERVA